MLWPFGNLGIDMSALASASVSACEYKDCFLHSMNRLYSYNWVLYIFEKCVIFDKVATCRL